MLTNNTTMLQLIDGGIVEIIKKIHLKCSFVSDDSKSEKKEI